MKYLSDIIEGLAFTELQGSADIEISAIVFDSRQVVPGCMFVAVKGTRSLMVTILSSRLVNDGAIAAVICEELPSRVTGEVDFLMVV